MTVNWQHAQTFSTELSPNIDDIDGLNHTNNAVYVKWCEQVAWQHSEALGISLQDFQSHNRAMAIIKAEYEYLAASHQGEQLVLSTCLSNCDLKMRLQRHFSMVRLSDNTTIFRGTWQFMCIEISSGKPKRMPDRFIEVYGNASKEK